MNIDLHIIETMGGGCIIAGPLFGDDPPGMRRYMGPVDPFNPFMTRKRAEKVLERMQQLESASLLA